MLPLFPQLFLRGAAGAEELQQNEMTTKASPMEKIFATTKYSNPSRQHLTTPSSNQVIAQVADSPDVPKLSLDAATLRRIDPTPFCRSTHVE
jgi:hypothetical protein